MNSEMGVGFFELTALILCFLSDTIAHLIFRAAVCSPFSTDRLRALVAFNPLRIRKRVAADSFPLYLYIYRAKERCEKNCLSRLTAVRFHRLKQGRHPLRVRSFLVSSRLSFPR